MKRQVVSCHWLQVDDCALMYTWPSTWKGQPGSALLVFGQGSPWSCCNDSNSWDKVIPWWASVHISAMPTNLQVDLRLLPLPERFPPASVSVSSSWGQFACCLTLGLASQSDPARLQAAVWRNRNIWENWNLGATGSRDILARTLQ